MNLRGFIATVLAAITAGLARPWWERGLEPHVLGNVGAAPTVNGLAFRKDVYVMAMEPLAAVEDSKQGDDDLK